MGSSITRRARSSVRTSSAAYTREPVSSRYGMPASRSAVSSWPSTVRAGMRTAMSRRRAGTGGRPPGGRTSQPSRTMRSMIAATSTASACRSVADQGPRRMGVGAEHRSPASPPGRASGGPRAPRSPVGPGCRRPRSCRSIKLVEHVVDPVDDRRGGAEVGGERDRLRVDEAGGAQEQVDVGPTEPVERLLGVADEEELARARCVVARLGGHGDGDRTMSSCSGSVSWYSSSRSAW